MDINKFISLREHLYHLTDEQNLDFILSSRKMNSTAVLAQLASVANIDAFLRSRRVGHVQIRNGKFSAILRDQDPLFRNIVIKNLEGGWSFEDFVYSLNSRVFFWATENDLRNHYLRYENQGEYPKILRVRSSDLINTNREQPQFCRLNSGAPRCSAYYKEGAPPRGPQTFQYANDYPYTPSSIREVTFLKSCNLPEEIWISSHPNKTYQKV